VVHDVLELFRSHEVEFVEATKDIVEVYAGASRGKGVTHLSQPTVDVGCYVGLGAYLGTFEDSLHDDDKVSWRGLRPFVEEDNPRSGLLGVVFPSFVKVHS